MLKAIVVVLATLSGAILVLAVLMLMGIPLALPGAPAPTHTPLALGPTPTPQLGPGPSLQCSTIEIEIDGVTYVQVGADGHEIRLCNSSTAADVSWSQLVAFLEDDRTDETPYQEGVFVCADFAERLHNNAELQGISAAWVGIEFYELDTGHALNAFNTTDRGLVYIDVTNVGIAPCSSDSLATVAEGQQIQYQLISPCPQFEVLPMEGIVKAVYITW